MIFVAIFATTLVLTLLLLAAATIFDWDLGTLIGLIGIVVHLLILLTVFLFHVWSWAL